ncbi:cell wall-binding repeat-containing protein [Microbacterium invictum]|uniref:Cell wall-binding protein n=1 Tax=Microbacterium invictum TaxID=515415 RepID=A0AA40SP45_9MICO|nr:cell wall-binding repeat-containing protein [Microbacterium invictum]MBB4139761.1 putative cell wall-binding protein [Microbacterium invictum]
MSRVRFSAALTAALALVFTSLASAAYAAAPPVDPGEGNVEVRVTYAAVDLIPGDEVEVSFWKLDEATSTYLPVEDPEWYATDTTWTSADLAPGSYSVRFLADDVSLGLQWWRGARYFVESEDIVVQAGATTALGTVELKERTLDVDRIAGADRFATAANIAREAVDGTAPVVYLTNGMNYPDALAAGPGAIASGGVLLLTQPGTLPAATRGELATLKPARVVIVGGSGAVSPAVEGAVKKLLPKARVDRLGGADRYATGDRIVRDAFRGGADIAIIATGRNYPDALAAGPAAGAIGAPVILLDGVAKTVPAATLKLLKDLKVKHLFIAGGTGAVSSGIETSLRKAGYGSADILRLAGGSRYETATMLNTAVFGATDVAFVANGLNFPDALAGAPLAGAWGAPLFLTPPACMGQDAAAGIVSHRSNGLILLGGTGALSPAVERFTLCG